VIVTDLSAYDCLSFLGEKADQPMAGYGDFLKLHESEVAASCNEVLKDWQNVQVIHSLTSEDEVQILSRRGNLTLISIDAPVSLRYQNFSKKHVRLAQSIDFHKFIELDDEVLLSFTFQGSFQIYYNTDLNSLIRQARFNFTNTEDLAAVLHASSMS